MKRKGTSTSRADTPIPAEEYRLFANQPESVLRAYRLARTSMAIGLPSFALIAILHPIFAFGFAVAVGITALLLLRKKYGWKGAVVPLICALSGVAVGVLFIAPLLDQALIIKEVCHGF
jgi:hypothetical protein